MVKNGTICPCWKRKMTKILDQEQTQAVCKNIMMKMILYVFLLFPAFTPPPPHTYTDRGLWLWIIPLGIGRFAVLQDLLSCEQAQTSICILAQRNFFFLRATQPIFKWRNVTKNKTQCILISCCQFGDILLFQPCFHYWPVLNRLEWVPLTIIKMRSLVRDTFPQNKMVDD